MAEPPQNSGPKPSGKAPFLAFLTQEDDRKTAREFATSRRLPEGNVLEGDIASATEYLRSNASPAVLIVELPSRDVAEGALSALAAVCDAETKVIVVGNVNEFSFYAWLTDLGISGYLLLPLSVPALEGAWVKATEVVSAAAKTKPPATMIGFIGARGGVGASSLAIMFTAMLQEQSKGKVVLMDLDPFDGCVSLMLDTDPSRGLREALERPDRVDGLFLDRVMQKTAQGFYILASEEPLHADLSIHASAAEALMNELRAQCDFIVLDTTRRMTPFVRKFIQECDVKFLVSDMSLQCLRDTLRISDFFRDVMRIKAPQVVANRIGMAPKHEIGEAEYKKGLSAEIDFKVPFAPEFFMQMGTELEQLKNKKAPAYKVLQSMVQKVLPVADVASAAPKKLGFFKKG